MLRVFISLVCAAGCSGEPTVCGQDSASVTLAGCLLVEKGIDYTALRLNDPNCTGQIDELNHTVTFSFNSSDTCGTVITVGSVLSTSSQISSGTLLSFSCSSVVRDLSVG